MATIPYTSNHPSMFTSPGVNGFKWEGLVAGSLDGAPVELSRRTDRTVQVIGTFDSATVTIQGSLDGTNWSTLNDLQGSALTFTSTRLEGVSEITTYIRPLVSSAGASTDVDVLLIEVGRGA